MNNKIKLGVSLYSFSTEYIHEKLDLEEILYKVKEMGYEGIEIVAAQMVPQYPYPTDEWLSWFGQLLRQLELKPVCWSAYIDMGIRSDRDLTEDEIVQFTLNDLIYAKKAGFDMIRTQHAISPKIFRQMIPYCKELGVKLTIEMHHPHHPQVDVWREYFEIMKGEGKGWLGFVPDFSIFQIMPHQLYLNQAVSLGCRQEYLDRIVELHGEGRLGEVLLSDNDFNEQERFTAEEMIHKFSAPARLDDLDDVMDCVFYVHGKFYYLDNDEHDPCVPYEPILKKFCDMGYEGYIASEYEGHHFDETIDTAQQLEYFVGLCSRHLERS